MPHDSRRAAAVHGNSRHGLIPGAPGDSLRKTIRVETTRGCAHEAPLMKTYEGKRTIDGIVVTVDGARLSEHYDVKRFTKYGFEWTYDGESPRQLALAILYDHIGDKDRAIALSAPYMKDVIANLDNDWTLTGAEIDAYLRQYAE
jgi:hypothetical protein